MKKIDVLTGKPITVFFSYTIPVVIGLIASSSAGIIDGMFIGNFIGNTALAAVTLCVPVFPVLMGIAILFSTGGEVFCGKFIGEGNYHKASEVFTKVSLVVFLISLLIAIFGFVFLNSLVTLLGAGEDINGMVTDYLRIIILSAPLVSTFSLSYFVRVDGNPKLSSLALLVTSILNVILDYIFIVHLDWGVKGAAWGTILSYSAMPLMVLPHFLLKKGKLHFIKITKSFRILRDIMYNGSSEFFSELSGGILLFIINTTMMKFYGTQGVAAYAIVGYLLYFTNMAFYGVSDSIKSIISINFGAKEYQRVSQILRIAIVTVVSFGLIIAVLTQINSTLFVQMFLQKDSVADVSSLANKFLLAISPVFLIMGANIILSAYFTALNRPKPSLVISLLRALILPIILIPVITNIIGGEGVITALIATEIATLIIALFLLIDKRKTHTLSTS